jgi:hypothetical protein
MKIHFGKETHAGRVFVLAGRVFVLAGRVFGFLPGALDKKSVTTLSRARKRKNDEAARLDLLYCL